MKQIELKNRYPDGYWGRVTHYSGVIQDEREKVRLEAKRKWDDNWSNERTVKFVYPPPISGEEAYWLARRMVDKEISQGDFFNVTQVKEMAKRGDL